MSLKTSTIIATLALAAAPLSSHAASPGPGAALNACVKAFVSTYLPNHPLRETRAVLPPDPTPISLWQPRKYTIALSARGVDSGAVLAEARCVANNNGIVLILDRPPTADYVARADFVANLR